MKIWFISDTHFGHNNIITYHNRPFNDVNEMNEILIENWNNKVSNKDIIFHLGDFSIGNEKEYIGRLNGRKFLILGNHEKKLPKFYISIGFEEVYKFPIIYNNFYILSHEPVYLNSYMPYVNIHGHIHSNKIECLSKDNKNLYYNVSVEKINYIPILFNKIEEKYK